MGVSGDESIDRARIGWWLFVLILGVAAAFIAYSFVGVLVLGIFGYYATRPINKRIDTRVDSDGVAAWVTVLVILIPLLLLVFYASIRAFQGVQQLIGATGGIGFDSMLEMLSNAQRRTVTSILENPSQAVENPQQTLETVLGSGAAVLSAIFGTLLLLALAVTLAYFLLENDDELAAGLCQLFGGRDTTAYAYASAVDEDLESVFYGNFLFVVAMAIIAVAAYWTTNAVAPEGLHVPLVFVLGFLTGVASLIPIVVGKIIYLPVVGLLALQALSVDGDQFLFVGAVLVAYFLVLDILPQTFLQPYITGRQLDMLMMMFAYLLGPILFGWYGFFLLPIIFVLMVEAIRIVLPELVHGDAVTPEVEMGDSIGTNPQAERDRVPDVDESIQDGDPAADSE